MATASKPERVPARPTVRRGPGIGRLLLAVNAFVLLVPVLALTLLRIYDTHLVRQTERRLIAESVVIGEAWRAELLAEGLLPPVEPDGLKPTGAPDERFFPIDPVLDLAYGVLDPEPPPRSTLAAEELRASPLRASAQALTPTLMRAQRFNLSGVRLLDAHGCVVGSTGDGLGDCLSHLPEVAEAMVGRYSAVPRRRISDEPPPPLSGIGRRGKVRVFTATPLVQGGDVVGVIRMSRTSPAPLEGIWEHRTTLLWALVGCVVLTGLVSWFLARRIARPVRSITDAARAVAAGESPTPLIPSGRVPAEVADLAEALERMTVQLTDRARWIEEFASNVSHELKTPLTSVRGAAELLREDWQSMSAEQRQRFLDNIHADADRMDRLVRGMLQLARIQSAPTESEAIDVAALVEGLARRPDGEVQVTVAPGLPSLNMNPAHLEVALRNLLDNALRHGAGAAVELRVQARGGRVEFAVRDGGPGISEGNRARIFDRFFTTERVRGGTGLGLAIVRAVAETRAGSITLDDASGGACFRLVV
jgi:signal transduction histidine kinase